MNINVRLGVEFCLGVGWIVFFTLASLSDVGKYSQHPNEPYPWYLPLVIFVWLLWPFMFGFLAGRASVQP